MGEVGSRRLAALGDLPRPPRWIASPIRREESSALARLCWSDVLCLCEWVTRDDLIATIPYVRNIKELRETTRACMTCFGCEGDLDELVAAHEDRFGTALG